MGINSPQQALAAVEADLDSLMVAEPVMLRLVLAIPEQRSCSPPAMPHHSRAIREKHSLSHRAEVDAQLSALPYRVRMYASA